MSTKLTELVGPDGSTNIYVQYEDVESNILQAVGFTGDVAERTKHFKKTMVSTIQGYSSMILNAVKESVTDHIAPDKVILEFGLLLAGETGIPFVTKGTAQANVKVTIHWSVEKTRQSRT